MALILYRVAAMRLGTSGKIRLGIMLLLICVASIHAQTAEAARQRPHEQHITARLRPNSKISLKHINGDKVATLRINNPPKTLLDRLRKQKGNFLTSIERVSFSHNVLTLKLHLLSAHVRLEHRILKRPRTLLISILSFSDHTTPEPSQLIGELPGLSLATTVPLILPRIGPRHPCKGVKRFERIMRLAQANKRVPNRLIKKILRRSKRGTCRSFVKSLLAENFLRNKASLRPFERWAYEIRNAPKWKKSPYLYQRTLLIGSYVLLKQKLYPEAAALLHSVESMEDRGLRPYVQIAKTTLALERNRLDEGLKSIRTLTSMTGKPARWHFAAYIAHASTAFRAQRLTETLETVVRADEQFAKNKDRGGQLWLLGAEAALRLGELKTARGLYRRTFREGTSWHAATALMRIGDLLARTQGSEALPKIKKDYWRKARAKSRGPALGQLLKLRNLLIATPRSSRDRARDISGIYQNALSDSVSLQAGFALTRTQQHRGNYKAAAKTVRALVEKFPFLAEDIIVRSTQGEILNAWFKQMARQGDWLDLVRVFNESSQGEIELLDSESTNHVANGFHQTGKIDRSVDLMLRILGTNIEENLREKITIHLWKAYANIGDLFRRKLVERYFLSRYPKSGEKWRFHAHSAIELMKKTKFNAAMRELKRAERSAPRGDPRQRVRLIRAEVQSLKGNANTASKTLRKQLPAIGQDPIEMQRIVVNILSECARACTKKNLELLVNALTDHQNKIKVNDRIRFLLKTRSVEFKETKEVIDRPETNGDATSETVPPPVAKTNAAKDAALRKSLGGNTPTPTKDVHNSTTPKGPTSSQPSADSGGSVDGKSSSVEHDGSSSTGGEKEPKSIWYELNKIAPDLKKKQSPKRRSTRKRSRRPKKTTSGGR